MDYYINTIIFSSGVIQGILLVIVLLKKRSNLFPNIFLGIFIGVVTLQVFIKLQGSSFQSNFMSPVYFILYYLPYLYGPLVYLYIKKSVSEQFDLNLKMVLHLIPFIISILIVLISGYKIIDLFDFINIDAYNILDTAFQIIILSAYIIAGKKLLSSKTSKAKTNIGSFDPVKWFNNFTNVVWITGISLIILFTLVFYNVEFMSIKFDNSSIAFLLLPLMIYWISYNALVNPELFINRNTAAIARPRETKFIKYQKNQLTDDEIENIIVKLNAFIVGEKGYMNPELTLDVLSKTVNIPRHHISQAINLRLNINFNDYINLQRLENVKKELLNPSKQHYTIAAIAFESGFNSISTFNEAFRKNTSMTPSEYKKSRLNK